MSVQDAAPLAEELEHLRSRYRKLAEDKSYYQLILQLMELLNPLPGLEDMLRGMLASIVECIGGTNIKLYYWIGEELHYIDFLGENKCLESVDDDAVEQAMRTHSLVEQRGSTEEALLMHGMLRGSYTWTFPLLVGQELVGVIKLENLHIHGASLGKYLPIFCSHAALIVGNEIRNIIRRRAEDDLRVATERLRLATEAGLIGIWDWDVVHDELVWDESMYRLYGRKSGEFGGAYEAWLAAVHPDDKVYVDREIQAGLRGEREYAPEFRVVWPDRSVHHVKAASRTFRDVAGKPLRMVGINYDLTERKRAEDESRVHLHFLEAMDRVNRAIQGAANLDQMMADVLDQILAIFDCDRAFLLYPCDPEAPSWQVPMEATSPEYPGVLALGHEVPTDPGVADTFRRLLAADGPLKFGPDTDNPLPATASERYGFKSILSMALRPRGGKAWQFGLHQCSHVRQWTALDERLFEEIGRRLADGLGTLLIRR
ncbi:MAG TPA: PAS domain-containing protein, partial [Rhodocyclaceae bacterium]|nr:PAS domain-containing protein [Rhodocyclaceae bacterium]